MSNPLIAELQREQAEIEALLMQCYAEINAASRCFEQTGDGGELWRRKFDERYRLMRDLKRVKNQITDALNTLPPLVGQAVEVYFNDQWQGRTTIRNVYERAGGGYVVSINPLSGGGLPLAFDDRGRCILRGFEDFTYRVACLETAQAA